MNPMTQHLFKVYFLLNIYFQINGQNVTNARHDEVVELLTTAGSDITLVVYRENARTTTKVKEDSPRIPIPSQSVWGETGLENVRNTSPRSVSQYDTASLTLSYPIPDTVSSSAGVDRSKRTEEDCPSRTVVSFKSDSRDDMIFPAETTDPRPSTAVSSCSVSAASHESCSVTPSTSAESQSTTSTLCHHPVSPFMTALSCGVPDSASSSPAVSISKISTTQANVVITETSTTFGSSLNALESVNSSSGLTVLLPSTASAPTTSSLPSVASTTSPLSVTSIPNSTKVLSPTSVVTVATSTTSVSRPTSSSSPYPNARHSNDCQQSSTPGRVTELFDALEKSCGNFLLPGSSYQGSHGAKNELTVSETGQGNSELGQFVTGDALTEHVSENADRYPVEVGSSLLAFDRYRLHFLNMLDIVSIVKLLYP